MLFADETLQRAAAGDSATLAALDERGLLPGAGETLTDYTTRLHQLQDRLTGLEQQLAETGSFTVENMTFQATDRIDPLLFAEASEKTRALFGFAVDWVPGFYVDPKCAWLFGGCAFSFDPDFFSLFIIRKVFATRSRWFLYSRRELLAHELAHAARFALYDAKYDERFAYLTAETGFRRSLGSVFRTPSDSFLLLGSTLLLLLAQVLKFSILPWLPMWLFWGLVAAAALFLAGRHLLTSAEFARARRSLGMVFGEHALPVLFRCSSAEIAELARLRNPQEARLWAEQRRDRDWRWRVIWTRFGTTPVQRGQNAGAYP